MSTFYVVHKGKNVGIYDTWTECKQQIVGYKGAIFKKFDNQSDADRFLMYGRIAEVTVIDNNFVADINVYTDGACYNNGKRNAKAGIGIYFGIDDPRNVSRRVEGKQTNNTAELTAIIVAHNILNEDIATRNKNIMIYSDSTYAIRACTTYGAKLCKKKWKQSVNKPIPNLELVKMAFELFQNKSNIRFMYIKAHTGNRDEHSIGNDCADTLASMSINNNRCHNNILSYINDSDDE
jgi:ribonuclease HI